ncbi:hypothetical protein OIDMADRAFT_179264 [Oidiodendron maius Zn]|uniref:Uncharacterized protein n=1 Tax=Oidiodendron maius (strain Zn) TaxID=913774 RepID=A0A0C3HI08_OIDMZ|nr:hypothetical protein OIDMADRAFT_179264 [Oidiodendron maius Zn]
MGNICGKESPPDPLAENVRPLPQGSSPHANQSSNVPRKVGGPPRTLGSGSEASPQSQEDARMKAAEAAEARATKAARATKGKLSSQLQEQKKQSRVDTLLASREVHADADAAEQIRQYN